MLAIYGSGGFGRELVGLGRNYLRRLGRQDEELVFVDDNPDSVHVMGIRILSLEKVEPLAEYIIAVGDGKARRILDERCRDAQLQPASLFANDACIGDDVEIGEGAVFCQRSLVTSSARIGRQFQCNIYSYVAHDCIIGDYVTFAPRVSCNGNVHIGDYAYVGTGAVIKQGETNRPLTIGSGAVVGMGAVVTKDVEPGSTVVGNPARPLGKTHG